MNTDIVFDRSKFQQFSHNAALSQNCLIVEISVFILWLSKMYFINIYYQFPGIQNHIDVFGL